MKSYLKRNYLIILFLAFCYFSLFLRLTSYPLLMWDESRLAENAFEMLKSKNIVVTTYAEVPDMWNTKPPLAVWIMTLFMKVFGYSELAVRLPSAIAALLTAVFIFQFVSRIQGNKAAGFFSGMVLISSIGFIGMHVARTADADALLVLFMTIFCLKFYEYLLGDEQSRRKNLFLLAVFFSLALLTKSSSALLPLPGLLAFVFLKRKQRIFFSPSFYIAGILSVLPLVIYCFAREQMNPGYFSAMWENDFGGRYLSTLENHSHGSEYYFMQLLNKRFFYWLIVLLFSLPVILIWGKKKNSLYTFCLLTGFSVLTIISFSRTKLDWYDAAVYPFFSIAAGISLSGFIDFISAKISARQASIRNSIVVVLFVAIFYYPYRKVLSYINIKPGEAAYIQLKYGPFMKEILKDDFGEPLYVYEKNYNSHLMYYKNIYNEKGSDVRIINSGESIQNGNLIATCDSATKIELGRNFNSEIFKEDEYCTCFRIK